MSHYLGVFGHTALDVILNVKNLPIPNSSVCVDNKVIRYGGTGANIAKCASELGVKTSLASFVGEDFPEDYHNFLKDSGVILKDLKKLEGYNTPTCWIITDEDENQMALMDQGPMTDMTDFELSTFTIDNSDIVHIGTGRPEYYKKVIDRALSLNKTIVFDPSQEISYVYDEETFRYFIERSQYFFCNKTELDLALKYLSLEHASSLLDYVEVVVVTRGKEGSSIYSQGEEVDIPVFKPKKVVDPTGAGDVYRGGFYAAHYRGYDLKECGIIGSVTASFALEKAGPQEGNFNWEDIRKRLEKNSYSIIN
ncbi:MAG: carbohydrate kinase family protein [Thermoplasmatota archaeon]